MCKAPTIRQFQKSFGTFEDVAGRWSGDAYGYHPHGVIMLPMIYADHHRIDGHCEAHVLTNPHGGFHSHDKGRDASIYGGPHGPLPKPKSGDAVLVYRNGKWVGCDGPWRMAMRRHMATVLRQIRQIRKDRQRQHEKIAAETQAANRALYKAAAAVF